MESESEIQARVMLAVGGLRGVRVFRNQVGTGWSGEVIENSGGRVLLRRPRFVRYGLVPGSGDLIGWRELVIRPEHVGRTIAQFVSLEMKTDRGRASLEQQNWLARLDAAGGVARVVRTEEEAFKAVTKS